MYIDSIVYKDENYSKFTLTVDSNGHMKVILYKNTIECVSPIHLDTIYFDNHGVVISNVADWLYARRNVFNMCYFKDRINMASFVIITPDRIDLEIRECIRVETVNGLKGGGG